MMPEWEQALQVAASPLPARQWRGALAGALASAPGVVSALVMTCRQYDLRLADASIHPPAEMDTAWLIDRHADERGAIAQKDRIAVILRSSDEQSLGAIALQLSPLCEDVYDSLCGVCEVAAHTLETALDLAASCGAQVRSVLRVPLSPRERQIAELACDGLSDLNIASRLGIGESTVGTHMANIYRKLEVHTRMDLARKLGSL